MKVHFPSKAPHKIRYAIKFQNSPAPNSCQEKDEVDEWFMVDTNNNGFNLAHIQYMEFLLIQYWNLNKQ